MMKNAPIKVVVCGHDQKFWKPIQTELEKTGQFEFREDLWRGHDEHDLEQSQACIDWADVIMAEWTMGNAVWYSKHKKAHQRLVTRLHLQERNTVFPGELELKNVDQIVFVGKHIQDEVNAKFDIPASRTCVVSNYVDYQRYSLPKKPESRFNLGIIGIVPMRKRLDKAIELLAKLLEEDQRYCLRIKGPRPDSYNWLWARTAEREYYEHLWSRIKSSGFANRVIFDPAGDDVQDWFQSIGYLLSPSDFESFHMAVPEGMCSGTIPVVWDWDGSDEIYRLLQPVKNVEEAASWITKMNQSSAGWRMAQQAKQYCKENFDRKTTVKQWFDLLADQSSGLSDNVAKTSSRLAVRGVLVFWFIGDWDTFHRKEMVEGLAEHLADGIEVLVVEPGEDRDALIAMGRETRATLEQYANNKPVRIAPGIHKTRIMKPQHVDELRQSSGGDLAGVKGSSNPLDELISGFYGDEAKLLHWIYKPNQVERLSKGDSEEYIYEIYDDYTRDFSSGKLLKSVQKQEERISQKARHVFFTAQTLEERKSEFCTEFSTVSNGVNYEVFETYRVDEPVRSDRNLRKSVGYLGNLSNFFDWELILQIVKNLPGVDFYFHGNIELQKLKNQQSAITELQGLGNVMFTGYVTREQGAAAIARYDVLIIPFVVNEAMHAVNPLKLWEYFATGRPVISSRMNATEHLSDVVHFANSVEEWCEKIENLTNNEISKADRLAQTKLAELHSWTYLTMDHAKVVNHLFSQLPDA